MPFGVKRTEASAGLAWSVRLAWQRPVSVFHTRLRQHQQQCEEQQQPSHGTMEWQPEGKSTEFRLSVFPPQPC